MTEAAGVRLIADGAAWDGHPGNLERRLTPVEVRLENQSGRTLEISYQLFDLVGESRFQYAALSPMQMREDQGSGPACVAGFTPGYAWGASWGWGPYWGAWRGAPWSPWGPGFYSGPFFPPPYWSTPYAWCEEPLPTRDMVKRKLPEGRLESGGTVAGFLYFQGVADRESQVILQARLVDANTGERLGALTIPFEVSRG